MSTSSRHLVIMAAGTGGHIMPGLAVADEMKRRGWTVSWLGTEGGMENRLVPPAGIPLDTISFTRPARQGFAKGARCWVASSCSRALPSAPAS
jgi:UDP-N-acetylglucosamine:LPS N-acetylglucosamine transferase